MLSFDISILVSMHHDGVGNEELVLYRERENLNSLSEPKAITIQHPANKATRLHAHGQLHERHKVYFSVGLAGTYMLRAPPAAGEGHPGVTLPPDGAPRPRARADGGRRGAHDARGVGRAAEKRWAIQTETSSPLPAVPRSSSTAALVSIVCAVILDGVGCVISEAIDGARARLPSIDRQHFFLSESSNLELYGTSPPTQQEGWLAWPDRGSSRSSAGGVDAHRQDAHAGPWLSKNVRVAAAASRGVAAVRGPGGRAAPEVDGSDIPAAAATTTAARTQGPPRGPLPTPGLAPDDNRGEAACAA